MTGQQRSRAHLLWAVLCIMAVTAAGFVGTRAAQGGGSAPGNVITDENENPGTTAWRLDRRADDIGLQIKGFADASSVSSGGEIDFHVSVTPAQDFTIEVFRMGWYDGTGGTLVATVGPLAGETQAAPSLNETTGMITTNWPVSHTLSIPSDWVAGVYLAKLTNAAQFDNYIVFTVTDGRSADILYQVPTASYQARNNFPNDGVLGKSTLPPPESFGPLTSRGLVQAYKVSFDRPYANDGAGGFLKTDLSMVMWMEREGYDVTYTTSYDVHTDGLDPATHKAFVSSGIDQHWTEEAYDAAESALAGGMSFGFFGASNLWWRFEWESERVIFARKAFNADLWRDSLRGRPEQQLVGVQYVTNEGCCLPLVVRNSDHWVWDGSGFDNGSRVRGIVGPVVDQRFDSYPGPEGAGYTRLANSPYPNAGSPATQETSIYQAPSGAWVFASGTTSWPWALQRDFWQSPENLESAGIQRATANVFDVMIGTTVPPTPTPTPEPTPSPTPGPNAPICDGRRATVVGTQNGDVIDGTPGNDVIVGRGGNDIIRSGGGRDRICGGKGADSITGGRGADRLFGSGGIDTVLGGRGSDALSGGKGRPDRCIGGPGTDTEGAGCERTESIP